MGTITSLPALGVAGAKLGYNIGALLGMPSDRMLTGLALVKAGGASIVRFQPAWVNVEDYATGGLQLSAKAELTLAWCAENAVAPICVCAYGPPLAHVATLTVGAGGASVGAYSVPISSGLSAVSTPGDHVLRSDGTQLVQSGKWASYGALIDTVDLGAGTLTLASQLTLALSPGDTLRVNRLRYPSVVDPSAADPGVAAYFRYLEFVASRIAAHGASGYAAIWNEPTWPLDSWPARANFYDTPPAGMASGGKMAGFLRYALSITSLPAGVRLISGATDKTATSGIVEQGLAPSSATVTSNIALESIHPYSPSPEGQLWNRGVPEGGAYEHLNPTADASSNFHKLPFVQDKANVGLGVIATECGLDAADDERHAVYLLRRVATSWACLCVPVIFAFTDKPFYNVVDPTTLTPRRAYLSLARLMALVRSLGAQDQRHAGASATLSVEGSPAWPLIAVHLYGANGALTLFWQQSGADQSGAWDAIPAPAPATVRISLPAGHVAQSLTDPLSGEPLQVPRAQKLTVAVRESPLALISAPGTACI